jgi:CRISPR-associated Csx3 family protein
MIQMVTIDVKQLYGDVAKLDRLQEYVSKAKEMAGMGQDVILTGQGPVWLYLAVAHALHGVTKSLTYDSPVTGKVVIFNHNPF